MQPVYLDYNATTPVDPEVAEAMEPFLRTWFGNPSSIHSYGIQTRMAVEQSRRQVAELLGAQPSEIIFTSGGTESNNLAIQGAARALRSRGNHIITTAVEHPAVLEVCRFLEKEGFIITRVGVDAFGLTDPEEVLRAIRPETILISVMHANNEVGSLQPVAAIGRLARERGILMHCDAAQSAGKIPVDVQELNVDLLSLAGHKLYAPKGVGALYIRQGVQIEKILFGADHEQNRRPGTENVLEIVGLGKACELAKRKLTEYAGHMADMRDLLQELILEAVPAARVHGHQVERLPNTLSIGFPGIEAATLLGAMPEVAASAGAACHSDQVTVSGVLSAMGVPVEIAMGTIRLSTGRFNTEEEIRQAAGIIINSVRSLSHDPVEISTGPSVSEVKLTQFTHGLGCACKLRPQDLEQVIRDLKVAVSPDILVGPETSDDAAVFRINDDTALVETVDFFTPVVDNPYDFGAIAAANALSDIYAMGGDPLFALNIAAFPAKRLSLEVLKEILRGAQDKAAEAGISILGGHTIEDNEPKYGMVVTGRVHPGRIWTNSNARPGAVLVLTKPLGTGVYSTALKRGLLLSDQASLLISTMAALNKAAAGVLRDFHVQACTDVTGFGLLGHLLEMTKASGADAEIHAASVPLLPQLMDLLAAGVVPGGTKNNLAFTGPWIDWPEPFDELKKLALCDAQTSGGLLAAIPEEEADAVMEALRRGGIPGAALIGRITRKGIGRITILSD
jgi:cysteine desulfurase NifS/selenium donor protein